MALTQQSSVGSDTAAFEQLAYFALRSQPMFEMVCDVKSTNQSHPGASVQFNIYNDLSQATSALTETSDVTAVALGDSTVTVTLVEYGNAVTTTAKLRGTSFLNVDADAANIIGYNMANSLDNVVHAILVAGSNVLFGGDATATGELAAGDIITAALVRKAVANARSASAPTFNGGVYVGFIHPDVSFDLRNATTVTDVIAHQNQQDASAIRTGSIGVYGGVDFIETPRLDIGTNTGASNVDEYETIICGKQAMAKATSRAAGFGDDPSIVFGPVTDSLRRFQTVGWYQLAGYSRFREASIRRIETSSSIGAN
jgi:N4-gp56 family major capsid protein|tara:strand:- start:112 stop:1050 length:939 start_codon:yes stop_codon:yes gene_type:complete